MSISLDDRLSWVNHSKGIYLLMDLSGLNDVQIMEVLMCCTDIYKNEKESSVRILVDVSNMKATSTSFATLRRVSKDGQKHLYRSTIVGMPKYVKPFFPFYKSFTGSKAELFDTREEALAFLFSD
jgi:hypothetical protein